MNKIKAYRDGQEREFTQKVWEAMGIGHCGWTAVPDVPKEVALTEGRILVREVYAAPSTIEEPKGSGFTAAGFATIAPKEVAGLVEVKSKDFKPRKTRQKK